MMTRVQELSNKFPQNVDAAIIYSPINRYYFSGFESSSGCLLVTKEDAYLLVDFRYIEAAQKNVKSCDVIMFEDFSRTLLNLIKKHNIKTVMLENDYLTLSQADVFALILNKYRVNIIKDKTLDNIIKDMRIIKSEWEVNKIKTAQKITELAFNHVLGLIRPGITEKDVALELEFFMRKNGAQRVAFDLIVVSGKNTSLPHGVPTDKQIQAGDFVTMDIGAVFEGYHSDMTRTVAVKAVNDEQRKVYDIVLKAQLEGIKAAKTGNTCKSVDDVVRGMISSYGYGEFFGHGTGHGVGLEIHEDPRVNCNCKINLKPGMIITIEPGIYLPNKFGVRIEDMVLIKESGCENLTNISKELIII